jgi:UDP-N-acetylmuramate--alanine ligase
MFWGRRQKMGVHLVGIGGSGMSGIAEVLLASDFRVSGSDLHLTPTTQRLIALGAQVFMGHAATNVTDPAVVVVSSAVPSENPEVREARRRGIPVIPRAEMLAELMRLKKGIAVAGSHGKTTTTTMLGQILRSIDPTVVVGGRVQHWGASSIVGKGSSFVIEADESDRSFLKFSPVYSIVTNIDLEHLDNYRDLDDIKQSFLEFLNRTAFFGENWINEDCAHLRSLRPFMTKPTKTYGFSESANLWIKDFEFRERRSYFECQYEGKRLGPFELPVVGKHNVSNACGAIGLALRLGVSEASIQRRLKSFVPADRRLQIHIETKRAAVLEDYGHHPTEVIAALEGARLLFPKATLKVIFQPHRFSRTKALWSEFLKCFQGRCEKLYLLPIYSAHESPIEGVSSERLAEELKSADLLTSLTVEYRAEPPSAQELLGETKEFSVFVVLGAGPLTKYSLQLKEAVSRLEIDDPVDAASH